MNLKLGLKTFSQNQELVSTNFSYEATYLILLLKSS